MTNPTRGNRLALLISLTALVVSLGVTAGPVMAKALVDADTVDGLHAVKAGASDAQRAGRLVATKASNGKLPNDLIALAPDSRLLAGAPASAYKGTYLPPFDTSVLAYPAQKTAMESVQVDTPRNGHLFVQLTESAKIHCSVTGDAVVAWFDVDGSNVDSSKQKLLEGDSRDLDLTLVGTTATVLDAGPHTVQAWLGCASGGYTQSVGLGGESGYAVVLPSSYQP
ncbi:MAG TPA: hypothetical protein VFJ89_06845 [Nocardioides sp.]|jgi:hypothetical protein|nr:hypothetical protein [Nocardioides sp.]